MTAALCIMDTSILVNILNIPFKAQEARAVREALSSKVASGERFLLPITAIIETGNFIGQVENGALRRELALDFATLVTQALEGHAPWAIADLPDSAELQSWLESSPEAFPNLAATGVGFGDALIIELWKKTREHHKPLGRRVYVWSLDAHLSGYDSA